DQIELVRIIPTGQLFDCHSMKADAGATVGEACLAPGNVEHRLGTVGRHYFQAMCCKPERILPGPTVEFEYTLAGSNNLFQISMENRYARNTDEELFSLLCAGKKDAFVELYTRYRSRIYAYSLRMIGDKERANDIFQETFIRIYQQCNNSQRTVSNVSAYIFT